MRALTDVSLAPLTTLRLGGRAARLVEVDDDDELRGVVAAADGKGEPLFVLGGGSNLVVADEGFAGIVVRLRTRGVRVALDGTKVVLDAAAGEEWDALVSRCVAEGWSGVESMAGIPGLVGAAPIQNIGAYGQEVRETIANVTVLDRERDDFVEMESAACGFGYRTSILKGTTRFVVARVRFILSRGGEGVVRYAELARALGCNEGDTAKLADIRATVLALRRAKGMVLDPADPDSVSAGSFFVNPILDSEALARLEQRALALGVVRAGESVPRFATGDARWKTSAGWLIERAGFVKGFGDGRAGVSRKHALALVNRGGATTAELLSLARAIRDGVRERFGVELTAEPVMIGCSL